MITERLAAAGRAAAIAALLIMFWFAVAAGMTLSPGITQAATIIFPSKFLMNNLPKDVSVLRWDRATASVTSADRAFVRSLYSAGAFLVLPARRTGCVDLSSPGNPTARPARRL